MCKYICTFTYTYIQAVETESFERAVVLRDALQHEVIHTLSLCLYVSFWFSSICCSVCCTLMQCLLQCLLHCLLQCWLQGPAMLNSGHKISRTGTSHCLCVAVCCGVLQCVSVCFSVLQCVAVCCSVL